MRVVDVELDRPEKVLHPIVLHVGAVDEVLVLSADHHLEPKRQIPVHGGFHSPTDRSDTFRNIHSILLNTTSFKLIIVPY